MPIKLGVVDLFAGPGGLGEGFASFTDEGRAPFDIGISVEKEGSAHRTLTLRAFLRQWKAKHGALPTKYRDFHAGVVPGVNWGELDASAWRHATEEALCLELGSSAAADALDGWITGSRRRYDDSILIGGPPCQAYSLVGRARSRGKRDYVPEQDHRHYLFREYISVLDRLRPAAFVMENVKGMLSSSVESRLVFEMLMEDLASLGRRGAQHYELRAIRISSGVARLEAAVQPSDYVVRAEQFGVPQRRHRVIIIGVRSDLAAAASHAAIRVQPGHTTVEDAIGDFPALRSGISRRPDDGEEWREEVSDVCRQLARLHRGQRDSDLKAAFAGVASRVMAGNPLPRASDTLPAGYGKAQTGLLKWLERPGLSALAQHETRGHMASDLGRYMFSAVYGATRGCSPKAEDFPAEISPDHQNWYSGVFSDRFRVQLAHQPSTTVTSHISKDGHYFIHPDPVQCRSLTVREAARLQTFPDDYLFLGNRTEQYVQVGNAVPPYLAGQIAALVFAAVGTPD